MRRTYLVAVTAIAVSLCFALARPAAAQGPARHAMSPTAGPTVALLDVGYIFLNHPRFRAKMEELASQAKAAEGKIKTEAQSLERQLNDLRKQTKGASFAQQEQDLLMKLGHLQTTMALQRKEFQKREAGIYYDTYREIFQEVNYYCSSRGISVVLRFDGTKVDLNIPKTVTAYVMNPVVWYSPHCNITQPVLDSLAPKTAPGPGPGPSANRNGIPFKR